MNRNKKGRALLIPFLFLVRISEHGGLRPLSLAYSLRPNRIALAFYHLLFIMVDGNWKKINFAVLLLSRVYNLSIYIWN